MDPTLRPRSGTFGAAPGVTSEPEVPITSFGPATFVSRIVRLFTLLGTVVAALTLILAGWNKHEPRTTVLGIGMFALVLVGFGVLNRMEPRLTTAGLLLGTVIHLVACAAMIGLAGILLF